MERLTQWTEKGASLILGDVQSVQEAYEVLQEQSKKAFNKLAELEDKLENGQLIDISDPSQRELDFDVIMKRVVYIFRRYGEEFRKEYGIKENDTSIENYTRISKAFEKVDEIMKEEMPDMWYRYALHV